MNPELYLSALTITDLDPTAKQTVAVIVSLADDDGALTASYPFLAAAMAVHSSTARRAASRACRAGYLAVDNRPGLPPVWRPGPRLSEMDPALLMRALGYQNARGGRAPRDVAHRDPGDRDRDRDPGAPAVENFHELRHVLGGEVAPQQKDSGSSRLVASASRLASLCSGNNRWFVRNEAVDVVTWAANALDIRRIDELIGAAATWPSKPVLPRAVAGPLRKAAAQAGVRLPPFVPVTPQAHNGSR